MVKATDTTRFTPNLSASDPLGMLRKTQMADAEVEKTTVSIGISIKLVKPATSVCIMSMTVTPQADT